MTGVAKLSRRGVLVCGDNKGDFSADFLARDPFPVVAKNIFGDAISDGLPLEAGYAICLGGEAVICEALNLGCTSVDVHAPTLAQMAS